MNPDVQESTFFLALRRMRAPLITLILIYAISVLGLTLIPGIDAEGQPTRMSFFHAFYFISYTATTIGFGEIPNAFSESQRLWIILCIYLSVIGWAYSIGALLALLQDQNFQNAVRVQRFNRVVRHLREPFYLVCGYGETGQLLCRALDQRGIRAVVVEIEEARVSQLDLHGHSADIPALVADARQPEILKLAGLTHRCCLGVIALTNDDDANLAIAICARLLAPALPALCRAETAETATNMASFGTRHIINPFDKFGRDLALALNAPAAYHLLEWLTGVPGTLVVPHRDPPRGHWLLCGYGRFGKAMVSALEQEGVLVTIIDHDPPPDDAQRHWVRGDGTGVPALLEAGVRNAVGIAACTCDDMSNLSIVVTARELNPELFVVLRQNLQANQALFDAFESDFTVVPSQIVARECLAILTTPLLAPFLWQIKQRGESWASTLLDQLTDRFGWQAPTVWSVCVDAGQSPALLNWLARNAQEIALGDLLRDPHDRAEELACRVLYLARDDGGSTVMLPHRRTAVRSGDQLLFVGQGAARRALELTLNNENTLDYVLRGREVPGGWVWERLARSHGGAARSADKTKADRTIA